MSTAAKINILVSMLNYTRETFGWPIEDAEVRAALERAYCDGSWGVYDGPNCAALVGALREFFQCESALLCSSGTVGVELALRGCGVEAGDEVVLAGYDFPGNFRAIEAIGARPVLIDVVGDTWCLDAAMLEKIVCERIKAVIVSHLHGGLADMERIVDVARSQGWHVVEDACQQPGAKIGDSLVGTCGDAGVLSFGGSKLLTSGRGGAVLTSAPEICQRMKVFSERGNLAFPLSELQAAVLLPQLQKLVERNLVRSERVDYLRKQTAEYSEWLRPVAVCDGAEAAYYKFAWSFVPAESRPELRERLLAELHAAEVPIDAGFRGFAGRSVRRCEKPFALPVCHALSQSTLLLHHPVLLAQEKAAHQVAEALGQAVRQVVS